jgi:hypothetical protein
VKESAGDYAIIFKAFLHNIVILRPIRWKENISDIEEIDRNSIHIEETQSIR